MQAVSEIEIYVHIPFCVKKCAYCDFLSFPSDEETRKAYVSALLNEIKLRKDEVARKGPNRSFLVTSVFFGGGTPTVLKADTLVSILKTIGDNFPLSKDCEITAECNPGTVCFEDLYTLKQGGFNRLSFGLQSGLDEELERIGRIHTYRQFEENYAAAFKAGFSNINVDLISALPNQKLSDIDKTLEKILSLDPQPTHISAYSLILEEGTRFMDLYEQGNLTLPDEDEERKMHWHIVDLLEKQGYRLYELSNLSKEGYECRHNLGYWTGKDYLGFGLGAASYFDKKRFSNTRNMAEYLKGGEISLSEYIELDTEDEMSEFMFLGLRKTRGISADTFKKRFCIDLFDVYGESINKHIDEGLLSFEEDYLKLTRRGQDLANYVFSDFV